MDATRIARRSAAALVAGAILQAGCGIAQIVGPLSAGEPGFGFRNTLVAIAQLVIAVGLAGLWRSGAITGRLGRIGLAAAIGASLLLVAAELTEPFQPAAAVPVYGVAAPLLGAGMLLAGIAVVRAGTWQGWGRFAPLACGLYVFVVLLPAFALAGGPSFPALTAYNLCWLALGGAVWAWASAGARDTAAARDGALR